MKRVSKTVRGGSVPREFESLPLRSVGKPHEYAVSRHHMSSVVATAVARFDDVTGLTDAKLANDCGGSLDRRSRWRTWVQLAEGVLRPELGAHTFRVRATDVASNTEPALAEAEWTFSAARRSSSRVGARRSVRAVHRGDADEGNTQARDPFEKSLQMGLVLDGPLDDRHSLVRFDLHALEGLRKAWAELAFHDEPIAHA